MQDSLDGRMQSANKDLVERSEDLQKRRRTVKCKMRKNGASGAIAGPGGERSWTE